jgi:RimJ/RimL family protein N-acetyltransferase
MKIKSDRILLRDWQPGDEPFLVRNANNRKVWINLRDRFPFPYRQADARRWVLQTCMLAPQTQFAIVVDGEAAGGIGLEIRSDVFRRSAEIGYWLGEPFWGRGIATEALRALTDYGFARFDLVRIDAGVFGWNRASIRVLEKAGYFLEGCLKKSVTKDGQTIDQFLYAKVKE